MRSRALRFLLALALVAALVFAWFARRASIDRVTLHVRDADLATVVDWIEWQTWETVLLGPGTTGRITLDVTDMPLPAVLDRVAEQARGRWSELIAIHSDSASLRSLTRAISTGEPSAPRWSNLASQLVPAPAALFARNAGGTEVPSWLPVTLAPQPIAAALHALNRYGRIQVLVEDGVRGEVRYDAADASLEDATRSIARQVGRKASRLFYLQSHFRGDPPQLPESPWDELARADDGTFDVRIPNGTEPVMIPLGGGPPVGGGEGIPLAPPPSPDAIREQIRSRLLESMRNLTPEQRAERLRQSRQLGPPGLPPPQSPPTP